MKRLERLSDPQLLGETKPGKESLHIKDILVDADALVALAKKDDSNHKKAVKAVEALQEEGRLYYVSPFTIFEAATVLSYKISHQAAKSFLKEARETNLPVLELPKRHQNLADEWFFKQRTKGISYFDCYNMALMESYAAQIARIFTFDTIYRKNDFPTTGELFKD